MATITQVEISNAKPPRPPKQQRLKGPHILKLNTFQLRGRLKQLNHRSLSALFFNLSKLSARDEISRIAERLGIKVLYVDEECSAKIKSLPRPQLIKLGSSSSPKDLAIFLAADLKMKLVLLPESETLVALADPRNLNVFKKLAIISLAEREQMEKELQTQILFYLLSNPYIGAF